MFATFSTRFKSEQSVVKQKQSFRFSKADKSEGVSVSDTCYEAEYKNEGNQINYYSNIKTSCGL